MRLFIEVDHYMAQFLNEYASYEQILNINVPGRGTMDLSILQIFTHVITREFHHKGQIMSKIRNLGYTPPDRCYSI